MEIKEIERKALVLPEKDSGVELELHRSNIRKAHLFSFFIFFQMISGILMPFFLDWGGLSFFEVMLLQSWFTFVILIAEIPCGAISDYISRKTSLVLCGIIAATAALIYGTYPSFYIFMLGETLWAFSAALLSGTNEALIYESLKKLDRTEDMQKIIARNQTMMLLGVLISAPIASILSLIIPLNRIFQLMFIPMIIAAIIALSMQEPNGERVKKKHHSYIKVVKSGFVELKHNKPLRILAIDIIIVEVLVFFLIWTYQLYLTEMVVPIFYFGFVAAGMIVSQILCTNITPKVEKYVKNKRRFLIGYTIIPGIGFILMTMIYSPLLSIVLILITIGFGMSRHIIFTNAINKRIESENRATVLSTISMVANFLRAIIYPIIGIIVGISLKATFIILGVSLITAAILTRVKTEYLT